MRAPAKPVVHLELHTGDLPRPAALYAQLCGWRAERIDAGCGAYWALELGGGFGGGIVECADQPPTLATVRAGRRDRRRPRSGRALWAAGAAGATEGPAGWRSVVATPAGAEVAFWQPKHRG